MKFVVLDLETTDFSPKKGGRIIEIGAVKIIDGVIVDKFSTFVNPFLKIPKKITKLTGITDDMVKDAPSVSKALCEFWNFIEGFPVVAHNAKFDWDTFLVDGFKDINKNISGQAFCTYKLSKALYKSSEYDSDGNKIKISHKLKDLCDRNNIELKDAHRAIADCEALAECVIKMSKEYPDKFSTLLDEKNFVKLDKDYDLGMDYQINKVRYWEPPDVKKRPELRRFYVDLVPNGINDLTEMCYPGSVIFEISSRSWKNKDFLYNLDYKQLEEKVMCFSKVRSLEELYYIKRREFKNMK